MEKNKKLGFETISPFLNTGNKSTRLFSYAGLTVGVVLLFSCIQMFINISTLLKEKSPHKDGFDFISVTKTITNENMGKDNRFMENEIVDFKKQSFITDAAPLISNQFRAKASAGDIIPFSTDLFLETIQNNFIDTLPASFKWQVGQEDIPIIFSADFLEMYNVFAPAQGLPQLSETTIGAVNITVECIGADGTSKNFRGHIVAVSDRLNTVLVPETFLRWANKVFSVQSQQPAARVYIKTIDANSGALQSYLQKNNYHVNKDKTKFGRIKSTLQAIVAGLGIIGVIVVLLSVLLFSFYLQLMISRSKDNLQLLLTLGYSPMWLSKIVTKKWIPVYAIIILIALVITQIFQFLFQQNFILGQDALSPYVHFYVIGIAIILCALCIYANFRLIKKQLYKL
jgi:hypothetical protein